MAGGVILFCVGATKAGTSWLYRYLHDHPDCRLRSIKELHYFDTVDTADFDTQFETWARLRRDLDGRLAGLGEGQHWRRANLRRQLDDLDELEGVLRLAQSGEAAAADAAYLAYLQRGEGAERLAADITPGYALLSVERLSMMARLSPAVRVLYLMRDPVERLWSHVRMQATRQQRPGEEVEVKSKRILNRVCKRGLETHIPARGDYRGTIERLQAAVPAGQLMVEFSERLLTETGLRRLCAFLGIGYRPADTGARAHEGVKVSIAPGSKRQAQDFLEPQYAYVAQNFGPLPERWQANWMGA
ncbi:sulfotransferase [Frigidibacter sp. MR17.24]|uniref:sulfotransferase n=1 Tax=Frigidibacter sp. MR17.24 TaxID=3127345 RepID=UPI0030131953